MTSKKQTKVITSKESVALWVVSVLTLIGAFWVIGHIFAATYRHFIEWPRSIERRIQGLENRPTCHTVGGEGWIIVGLGTSRVTSTTTPDPEVVCND